MNLRCDESVVIKCVKYLVIRGRSEAAGKLRGHVRMLFTEATQGRAHQTDPVVFVCREQKRETQLSILPI